MDYPTLQLLKIKPDQIDQGLDLTKPHLEIFEYADKLNNRASQILKKVFTKLDVPWYIRQNLYVDLTIPFYPGTNIGGYFNTQKRFIALNPLLLIECDEVKIAEVIQHEWIHYQGILDENMTQLATEEIILEKYGRLGFVSGYQEIMEEIQPYFELSAQELIETLTEGTDQESFDFIIEKVVLEPLFHSDNVANNLTWTNIQRELTYKWGFLLQAFPRLINQVDDRNVDPFTNAVMSQNDYNLNTLMFAAARKIFENPYYLNSIIMQVSGDNLADLTAIERVFIEDALFKAGYGYLVDYALLMNIDFLQISF